MFPPLNPLRVFSFAARLGSFTQAAAELNVSQSAVSRQIGVLERYLGIQLFRRERDGVELTGEGRDYYENVASAFYAIESATDQLAESKRSKPVRLRVYSTFAVKWLAWRLGRLEKDLPEIKLHFTQSIRPINFNRDSADVAIEFGNGHWPDMNSVLLMPDKLQPICSPALLQSGPPLTTIDDLKYYPMLRTKYQDWSDWLRAVGRPDLLNDSQTVFDGSLLSYQAAIDGLGIAVGQVKLLERDIERGLLVPLFDRAIERELGYYAIWPKNRTTRKEITRLVSWLNREAQK